MKRKRIDFRWLNLDREEFVTRAQLERYAQKHEGGVWQAKVDDQFNPGILMAYGQRTYSRKKMIEIDNETRQS